MALPELTSGLLGALLVVGLFGITTGFFILNKLGFVRNNEEETSESPEADV
jgi:hypothetical protein